MQYRFYVPEHGETAEDARAIEAKCYSFDDAAEEAAEQYHPGAEWWEGSIVFAILDETGAEGRFSVLLEYSPTFSASAEGPVVLP
jgi:hypothetical protein